MRQLSLLPVKVEGSLGWSCPVWEKAGDVLDKWAAGQI